MTGSKRDATAPTISTTPRGWHPDSWRDHPVAQGINYPDPAKLAAAVETLRNMPPLVTSWEIERLKKHLADAQEGRRFILQGGDCAETLADTRPRVISAKLKILMQMSLVLVHGSMKPVVRIGRIAGQYAKPRSQPTERGKLADGREVELPNYFGDLVNRAEFTPEARAADPQLLLAGYQHAALTLNFVRSLTEGGFADLHHPEQWDLAFFENAVLPGTLREEYQRTSRQLSEALRFMEALGEKTIDDLTRVEFYTSHEGLNLEYESAQTRTVPRRDQWYDLTTHLPWIGERTRQLDGAHVEFFRGIANPVGVKISASAKPDEVLRLIEMLSPDDEPGKIVLITRMGVRRAADALPGLLSAIKASGRRVLWICDPMHGNTQTTSSGRKTRDFGDILREIEITMDAHAAAGTVMGGVHFELTGEDVTECVGGAAGITEGDLEMNYATACDPRLNYRQALEMAFSIARKLRNR
ncbi:3-deoxy-7-phosphoheptulonate synthase class II [Sandaracinus amylolyticus]|uniref:3-deoxy-7-phosphoheptulonate synthase class II n=1 Tax=Sandaracinus amylolyticus TaxID=927083 RepID=UPI001F2B6D95|nr:3-deoxy-7-phosphoheptulonate synthase class II [Sandaracinus amylolyticus]UJR79950.1 3-deoxy-7-phosphoheptulonate synthase class II [Sandaracinus amylolyticus]